MYIYVYIYIIWDRVENGPHKTNNNGGLHISKAAILLSFLSQV